MLAGLVIVLLCSADVEVGYVDQAPTRLETTARVGVERVLSFVLDTPTTVQATQLDTEKGALTLKNVRIANPSGFGKEHAIAVEAVLVEADPRLLFSREPVVRLIDVKGAIINAETTLTKGSNLKRLMDNAARFADKKLLERLPKKRWRIEKGILDDCRVNLTTALPVKRTNEVKLDRMEMSFLGKDGKGVTADEAMRQFLSALLDKLGLVEKASPLSTLIELLDG